VAIFAETDIQASLNGIRPLLSEAASKQLHGRLKSRNAKDALSAEWEIVLINALRSCGNVEIEPLLRSPSGESRPDVLLRPATGCTSALSRPCYVEISAVSDDGYEDENPQKLFIAAFRWLLKRMRLPAECFRVEISGSVQDETLEKRKADERIGRATRDGRIDWEAWLRGSRLNDRKMRLALPAKSGINSLLCKKFVPVLRAVSREPARRHTASICDDGVLVDLLYDPLGRGFSYSFPSYTTAYSLAYNPIANRLNAKADQLARGSGLRGVILCDRGCDLLVDRVYPGPDAFRLRDVVTNVLARRSEISFVITYAIHQVVNGWGRYAGLQLSVSAFYNPEKASCAIRENEFDGLVRAISDHLPVPVEAPKNAALALPRCAARKSQAADLGAM
jgi:hypothetical protein